MLHIQWWFEDCDKYKSITEFCRWGRAYKKETCLWHPFGRTHVWCARQWHHFPNGAPSKGRASHPYTIGGVIFRALKGAEEVIHRNRIPGRLLRYLLTFAKEGTCVLDLCSGYQTNRNAVEEAGLIYIAADIADFFSQTWL